MQQLSRYFWRPECLDVCYYTSEEGDRLPPPSLPPPSASASAMFEAFGTTGLGPEPKVEVASVRPFKRYVERRNWLHPVWSFWRIHAFLLLSLHMMLCLAFCNT